MTDLNEAMKKAIELWINDADYENGNGGTFKMNLEYIKKNEKGEIVDADIESISLLKSSNSRELE